MQNLDVGILINLIWRNGHFTEYWIFNVFKYLKIVGNYSQKIDSRLLLTFLNDMLGLIRIG